jgi:hypothetical protein
VATLLGCSGAGGALADHSHHHDATGIAAVGSTLTASLGAVAAQYSTASFVGDYQGLTPGLRWTGSRFAASTNVGVYRLRKNGARYAGLGDLFIQGQAAIVGHHARSAGLALAVSAPTGSQRDGLGMGHVMVMPALWGSHALGDLTLAASCGYGRAIGANDGDEHEHGAGPIVDPMNFSELTWSASGDLRVAQALRLGVRVGGALAFSDSGTDRAIAAGRAMWTGGRLDTSAEIQVGLAGDPFNVRGIVETALRF